MKGLRVLHVDTGREMRGGQWQALHLIQGLMARHMQPVLVCPPRSPLASEAKRAGIEVFPFSVSALRKSCDLIHAHDARAHTAAAIAGKAAVVVSRRVAFPIRSSCASRWKYGQAAHFIAVSRYVERVLVQGGVPPGKITVVPDGVAVPVSAAEPSLDFLALNSKDPGKGRALIEAALQLSGFAMHWTSDPERDLPRAACFLYISGSEGLGSAALLAMAHGVPVIASATGGLPEAVEQGVTGILVPNDPAEIAGAMRVIKNDRALACRLGRNGRERVLARFTVDHMIEGTLAVYKRVVE